MDAFGGETRAFNVVNGLGTITILNRRGVPPGVVREV